MIVAANLLPVARRRARAAKRRVRIWAVVCAVVALGLMGSYTSLSSMESGDRARLERNLGAVGRQVDSLEREVAEAKAKNGDAARRLSTTKAMVDHPDWSVLLLLLSDEREGRIMLQRVALKPAEVPKDPKAPKAGAGAGANAEMFTVRIAGLSATQADVLAYASALEGLALFDSVKPLETRSQTVLGRELVGFELECVLASRTAEATPKNGGGR